MEVTSAIDELVNEVYVVSGNRSSKKVDNGGVVRLANGGDLLADCLRV